MVFYEILTGQLPFQAEDRLQWVHAHMAQKPISPREINPDIPLAVSSILLKLLSKTPRERYQRSAGLLSDLTECRRQLSQTGFIEPFTLGRVDLSGLFQLPRRLYGREKEVEFLASVFERVVSGQPGLLLVHGYAGIGKTLLINQTLRPVTAGKGYFATGKCDQLQQNIPYAPFIQALGGLIQQFLTESQESLCARKKGLNDALGRNGAVITEVIPEVELIIGPQPPVPTLPPREALNRFRMVFRNFIQAIAPKEHPLVIFLDDLHWADPASLSLIQLLGEDADIRYLFLIGAYRDDEVPDRHPLLNTLEELQKMGILYNLILTPLDPIHSNQLVADTLHCTAERTEPLAEILYRKTGGNPFFLRQLMQTAYEENLLSFNDQDGCLMWDPPSIQAMPMSNDALNLMLGKLLKLPVDLQKILKLAACIGGTFDLKTLAIACEQTPGQTAAALRSSIVEGLVLLINDHVETETMVQQDNQTDSVVDSAARYEFLHDRVHQAAYSLIPDEEKKELHLQMGRLVLRNTAKDELDDKIFNIMGHLNRSLDLIKDPAERIELAGYNLIAGRKAKIAVAYNSALNYFKAGLELLPENCWAENYLLTYELHLESLQGEYLCLNINAAEQLFDLLLDKAETNLERAGIYGVKMELSSGIEKYHEALQLGIKGLSLLGVNLQLEPGKYAFIKEIIPIKWRLHRRRLSDFVSSPLNIDPIQKSVISLLNGLSLAACRVNPELFTVILLKTSNLALKYGYVDHLSLSYVCYRFFTGRVLGDYKTISEFKKEALKLIEKCDNSLHKCILYFVIGTYVSHWAEHGKTSVNYLKKAVDFGLEAGELLFTGYSATLLIENKYLLGNPLEELDQECQNYYNLTKRVRLLNYKLLIASLRGVAGDLGDYSEEDLRKITKGDIKAIFAYRFSEMQLFYLAGDYQKALSFAELAHQNINAIRNYMLFAEYIFYYSLSITAVYEGLTTRQKRKYRKILRDNQQRMKKWSDSCPANFGHKYLLIAAETARLFNQDSKAMTLYDQSIQSARENYFVQNEAIAGELAAKFYLARGRDKVAQVYLTDAWHGYSKWGGVRKAQMLREQYPHLLAETTMEEDELAIIKSTFLYSAVEDSDSPNGRDLYAIQKAVQGLSEETDRATLLNGFLEIAVANAMADKGYLILEKNERLFVEVALASDMAVRPLPLEKCFKLSQAMVRYAARTQETVVLNDGEQVGIFARDLYLAQSQAISIVCLPLLCRGILMGVLYLENSLMSGVFTPDRLETLKFLSTQIAYVQKLQWFLEEEAVGAGGETLQPPVAPLTEREQEVLSLIAAGMSNKEIALELNVSVNTVKKHVLKIYEKLRVNRRVQAVAKARELKIFP